MLQVIQLSSVAAHVVKHLALGMKTLGRVFDDLAVKVGVFPNETAERRAEASIRPTNPRFLSAVIGEGENTGRVGRVPGE